MKQEHKIALLGLGTVGSGVWKILSEKKDMLLARTEHQFTIKKILVKDLKKKRSVSVPSSFFVSKADDILKDPEIDIVVEVMGGHEPAGTYITQALQAGKAVVTANKALLAERGVELFKLARQKGLSLGFEASVAGGIPIIKSIREGFIGNQIQELYGIINGTSNFILSEMTAHGSDFATVLAQAQKEGYAEQNPDFDVKGIDAAQKLSLLTSICYDVEPPKNGIYVEGIDRITPLDIQFAKKLGYVIKLLAITKAQYFNQPHSGAEGEAPSGLPVEGATRAPVIDARVHPTMIPEKHPLADVSGIYNAIFLKGDAVGETMFLGRGAGSMPTASAVVSDIVMAATGRGTSLTTASLRPMTLQSIEDLQSEYYLRFSVIDKPGVLAEIANCLGDADISIAAVYQRERDLGSRVPIVVMTHEALEKNVREALKKIDELESVLDESVLIRVLKR